MPIMKASDPSIGEIDRHGKYKFKWPSDQIGLKKKLYFTIPNRLNTVTIYLKNVLEKSRPTKAGYA